MNKEKQFDCIQFKNELQKNLLEKSGATNLREYVQYANKFAQHSSLHILSDPLRQPAAKSLHLHKVAVPEGAAL